MTKLRVLTYLVMMGLPLLFNQCRPTESELASPDKSKHSGAREASSCSNVSEVATTATVGKTVGSGEFHGYNVTFISSTAIVPGSVWEYQVEKIGNGGGNIYLSMGCVTKDDYEYVYVGEDDINGQGFTHGRNCSEVDEAGFLKIAGINSAFKDDVTTITIKIGLKVNVDQTAGTVSTQFCENQPMVTPGCYHVCGTIQQAECVGDPILLANETITLTNAVNSYTTTTDADGTYCFCPIMPGSYTLTVAGQTTTVTVGPGSIDAFPFTVPAICNGCSFSQGFYFSSPVGVAYSASKYNLTVGGQSYSQADAIAIFKGRAGGSANLSNIFTQCATIKLSVALGSTTLSAPLEGYVNTLDTYLSGMAKLNGSTLLANSKLPKMSGGIQTANAVAAANAISLWIYEHHCTEIVP
jgi:hypothetical protein